MRRRKKTTTREQYAKIGEWSVWALRQPNARELFRERGAKCEHGRVCTACVEAMRTKISQITAGQSQEEPS